MIMYGNIICILALIAIIACFVMTIVHLINVAFTYGDGKLIVNLKRFFICLVILFCIAVGAFCLWG